MNKKITFITISTFMIVIAFLPFVFAQIPFDYCKVSTYGTLISDSSVGFTMQVTTLPSGLENITNTLELKNDNSDDIFTFDLVPGDRLQVIYSGVMNLRIDPSSEPDHFTFQFEGTTMWTTLNGTDVPEFSPILLAPLFIAVTLLALIYRRKHKT
ncbi:MAG: hypothetical protein P8X97_05875 [Candidatus Bathyarchaeota archaeon]